MPSTKQKNKTDRKITVYLAQVVDSAGVPMRQVARDTDMTPATLSRIKTGKQRPDLETIEKLCNYFECDLSDLVRLE